MMLDYILMFTQNPILSFIGAATSLVTVFWVLSMILMAAIGISPILWRFGIGRMCRKIAVVSSSSDNFSQLQELLVVSGVFKKSRVKKCDPKHNLASIENYSMLLVDYASIKDSRVTTLEEILDKKKANSALVVYAPNSSGRLTPDQMDGINKRSNTSICNFRGRLINDLVLSLITTSYSHDKK